MSIDMLGHFKRWNICGAWGGFFTYSLLLYHLLFHAGQTFVVYQFWGWGSDSKPEIETNRVLYARHSLTKI